MASSVQLTNSVGKTVSIVGDDTITYDTSYNLSTNIYSIYILKEQKQDSSLEVKKMLK